MKKSLALIALVALIIPGLPWKTPVATAAGVNLVPNPSFETGTTSPTSWTKVNGSAKNTVVFTYPVAGFDGAKAAEVTLTNYKSGDVGWSSANFPVVAGTQYDLTEYSKSNVTSTMLAVYTRSNGKSTTATLGSITATSAWKPFTMTLTIPTGVTTMSLSNVLRRNGVLDVDAYSLVQHVTPPVSGNLVLNGDFETANPTNPALPDHWSVGGWGTNTAVYTYPATGKTGKGAKVDVTSYTSGDAKWVFDPIASSAGKTYNVQFDYTSNVTTNVSVEFHMTDGTFTYGWLGDPVASAGWTTFSKQLTIPSGADSFSVFQVLESVGSLTVDNFVVTDITTGSLLFPNGMVTLEFDDTLSSQYTAGRPILNAAGLKASFYAITSPDVGIGSDSSYMTWAQVLQLKADGMEIGAHTQTHPDLTYPCLAPSDPNYVASYCSMTPAQKLAAAQAEIVGSKNDLIAHGITPTTFVYPYGVFNSSIEQMVKDAGFVGARSVFDGFNFPSNDKYALLDKHIESTTTIADVQGWINQAKANKTWLIMELHDQTATGPDVYHNSPALLQQIVNYIVSSGIQNVTAAQGIALMNP